MIRVALLSDYPRQNAPAVGGVQAASVRLVKALASRDVSVTVVAPGLAGSYLCGTTRVYGAPVEYRYALLHGYRRWRRAARSALATLDSDVVHGQGLIPGGLAAAEAVGVPRVVTAQGNVVQDTLAVYRGPGRWPRALLRRRLAARAVRRADVVVAAHPDWRWNMPVHPASFVYIPTVVDEAFFEHSRSRVPGRVLFCGGARRIKGFDVLARAWPQVALRVDAHLLAVGFTESEVPSSIDGDTCEIRGWLDAAALAREMQSASVVVIPSRFDVAPVVLAEAWAARTPVVATRTGGLGPLAEGAAVIVPPDDPKALADALVGVLERPEETAGYVAEGISRARRWSADAVADAHVELYLRLSSR